MLLFIAPNTLYALTMPTPLHSANANTTANINRGMQIFTLSMLKDEGY